MIRTTTRALLVALMLTPAVLLTGCAPVVAWSGTVHYHINRAELGRMIKKMKGGDTTIKPQDVWNSFVSWKGYFQDSDAYNRIHKMELELRRKMQ